jgi:hypothetical protein
MFIRQTMLVRESATLVQAWPARENSHLGSRPANKPSVTPRAARLVWVIVYGSPMITPLF